MKAAGLAGMLGCAAILLLTSCAAPPLTTYTLSAPSRIAAPAPPAARPMVIAVARIALPDDLDNQDIVVRDGSILRRSQKGRWASRLSVGMTDRLTSRLAQRRPDAVVTDRPLTQTPNFRLLINLGRLDLTSGGTATLEADWLIVPANPAQPIRHGRTRFTLDGPVATDQDIVALIGRVTDRLAAAINIRALSGSGRHTV